MEARENPPAPWWARALAPAGALYLQASRLNLALKGRRPVRLPLPALSVGNLTFGGTGKTPVTLALARRLRDLGREPGVALRGYGRTTTGALLVNPTDAPSDVGDEALLYARAGFPTAVAERREEAASYLSGLGCRTLLLDDAFQHVRVARDLDVLLVDARRPGDLRPPPAGRLREPLSGARRAGLVVVTRGGPGRLPPRLAPFLSGTPAVGARLTWAPSSGDGLWEDLRGRPVVAFAGVGNPAAFFADVTAEGIVLRDALAFPDHAEATPERLAAVLAAAARAGAEAVLTTEKDAVKWSPLWPSPLPLVWPSLQVDFDDPGGLLDAALARLAGASP